MRRRNEITADYQEKYLVNESPPDPDFPGISVHAFCHSFLKPSWKSNREALPYIMVSMMLSGDSVYLNPDGDRIQHKRHYFVISDLNLVHKNIYKLHDTVERYFVLLRVNRFLRELLQCMFPAGMPQFMPSHPEKLKQCFEDIQRVMRRKGKTDDLRLGAMTFRLLCEAARQIPRHESKPVPLANALSYIDNRFCDPALSRQELASASGISLVSLDRLFHDCLNTTVNHYITDYRMEKAKSLLEHTRQPIGEIAEQCGFSYRYYFAKVFRSKTGVTPLKYRSSAQIDKIAGN